MPIYEFPSHLSIGCFLSRPPVVLPPPRAAILASYSTHPSSKNGTRPHQWFSLDPELEEMLVPRKMSISPLESWLTVHYFLSQTGGIINIHERNSPQPLQQYDLPAPSRGTEAEEKEEAEQGGEMNRPRMECRNILKIRRRKMNRHKYKKLMKRTKFARRKILEQRMWRKQVSWAGNGEAHRPLGEEHLWLYSMAESLLS